MVRPEKSTPWSDWFIPIKGQNFESTHLKIIYIWLLSVAVFRTVRQVGDPMSVMHIGSYGHNFICLNPNLSLLIEKTPLVWVKTIDIMIRPTSTTQMVSCTLGRTKTCLNACDCNQERPRHLIHRSLLTSRTGVKSCMEAGSRLANVA